SPDVIVTDEIGQAEDIEAIEYATRCGVKILASCHCDSIESFVKKPLFEKLISEKIFKRFVLLSKRNGPGTYEGIYDENLSRIFVR
ncbi:MAG: stage III sporulation protein AA, partial [Clostridia bacterium]|nr:stage III sporulation protein AA [Clostridia bacterium]